MHKLVRIGILRPGDWLVLDNAAIHFAFEIQDELEALLDRNQIRLIFLPTYSPELNPCELIFGQTKYRFYRRRRGADLAREIACGLATVSWENVLAYYVHCMEGIIFGPPPHPTPPPPRTHPTPPHKHTHTTHTQTHTRTQTHTKKTHCIGPPLTHTCVRARGRLSLKAQVVKARKQVAAQTELPQRGRQREH